jgi:hypothetical protein
MSGSGSQDALQLSDDDGRPVDRMPDVAAPLLGFRSWKWDGAHRLLVSPASEGTVWLPGKDLRAECRHSRGKGHEVPDEQCSCGIYAATDIERAAPYTGAGHVFGLVWGFGRTVPGDNGFRAAYGRVAAVLAVVREVSLDRMQLKRVAKAYSVPLLVPHSLDVESYRGADGNSISDPDEELRRMIEGGTGDSHEGRDTP